MGTKRALNCFRYFQFLYELRYVWENDVYEDLSWNIFCNFTKLYKYVIVVSSRQIKLHHGDSILQTLFFLLEEIN